MQNAPIAEYPFPLVLFSPGSGLARADYTSWVEGFSSWGFVVTAIDYPFAGLALVDGRVFENQPHPDGLDQYDYTDVATTGELTLLSHLDVVSPPATAALMH